MSLPVCPECKGKGEWYRCRGCGVEHKTAPFNTCMPEPGGPCRACGGSGVDITEAVEAGAEALFDLVVGANAVNPFGFYKSDEQYRTRARAVLVAALAVLDKEGNK